MAALKTRGLRTSSSIVSSFRHSDLFVIRSLIRHSDLLCHLRYADFLLIIFFHDRNPARTARPVSQTDPRPLCPAREGASVACTGVTPCLAAVLVGNDPASATYVKMKGKRCEAVGMKSLRIELLPDGTTTIPAQLVDRIASQVGGKTRRSTASCSSTPCRTTSTSGPRSRPSPSKKMWMPSPSTASARFHSTSPTKASAPAPPRGSCG